MTLASGVLGSVFVVSGIYMIWATPRLDMWLRSRRLGGGHTEPTEQLPGTSSVRRLSDLASSVDFTAEETLNVRTWAISKERDSYLARRARSFLYAIAGGSLLLGAFIFFAGQKDAQKLSNPALWRTAASAAGVLGALVVIYATVPYFSARSAYRQRRLALASARVDDAITRACEGETPLKIGRLFELNRRQLDEYQLITRKQQRTSFLLAQAASVVAFMVLVTGVFVALSSKSDVDKYLTSGLTALGSLLSGFLAATFFGSAKDANRQMNLYYLEPQRTGRLLAAERIVTQIEPDGPSRGEMVSAVLGWDMPGDEPSTPDGAGTPQDSHSYPAASNGVRNPSGVAGGG